MAAQKPEQEEVQAGPDLEALAARFEASLGAMEERVREAEERAAAAEARAQAPSGDALAEILARLVDQQAELGQHRPEMTGTFKPGESADDVLRSLAGTVTEGEVPEGMEPLAVPVTFRSRGSNLCLVRLSRHRVTMPNGEVQTSPGIHYDFSPNGEFTTDNPDAVAWIRGRQTFNTEFFEVGAEPDRIPSSDAVLESVVRAAMDRDLHTLEELEAMEQAGYARTDVLAAVRGARRQVEMQLAEQEPVEA